MLTQYRCKSELRRQAIRSQTLPKINGIDYLEVDPGQRKLYVYFIHNLPGSSKPVPPLPAPELILANVVIEGGVRIRGIQVKDVLPKDNRLTVTVSPPGDFSTYTLRLIDPSSRTEPPAGFDRLLSEVDFSFKVECPSDFDCKTELVCPPKALPEPQIDYLAKDYASFRRLMLDRLSLLMPDWKERHPADLQVALVEALAYLGDHLSYYQDAVATEAYLGTARKRVSVRRHARLLDYWVHDGCNARVWVQVKVPKDVTGQVLPERTMLLTRIPDQPAQIEPHAPAKKALQANPTVFETLHDLYLFHEHNEIHFYTWQDEQCCLPQGATRATLKGKYENLKAGDVLIFEERLSPTTGLEADADPEHRHAVRLTRVVTSASSKDLLDDQPITEIEWPLEDALPFPLCISALTAPTFGQKSLADVSVVHGNVVLADHGRTYPRTELEETREQLLAVSGDGRYRPTLKLSPVTQQGRVWEWNWKRNQPTGKLVPVDLGASATSALRWDMDNVRPAVKLVDPANPDEPWTPQRDLFRSNRFAREFVVEVGENGRAQLRFGDDVFGLKPTAGMALNAYYRVGNGREGNVGREVIAHVVTDVKTIEAVRNPMPARGGVEPEQLEQVRLYAPQAFRKQERAVTADDYAEVAERHAEVQKARATIRWTGSWYTAFVTIDRRGGREVDADFRREMSAHLERYRMAGFDVEVNAPIFVPLDLALSVCVKPGYFRSNVKRALLEALSSYSLPRGGRGFFHPDNFTFGQSVYLSQIYKVATEVTGVDWVEVTRFQRWGKTANQELETGVLEVERLEIPRLDNDPNFPENGRLELMLNGGQ